MNLPTKQFLLIAVGFMLLTGSISCGRMEVADEQCFDAFCTENAANRPINNQPEDVEDEVVPDPQNPQTDFSHLDPDKIIPSYLLEKVIKRYEDLKSEIDNHNYMVVFDVSQKASKQRLYLIDLKTGKVEKFLASHGSGSDPDGDGYATKFSNKKGSHMTSLGAYITHSTYIGGHGYSMQLRGMDSTNSAAFDRLVVMHGASYVKEKFKYAGRSQGCPAVDPKVNRYLVDKIKNGSLLLITYGNQ